MAGNHCKIDNELPKEKDDYALPENTFIISPNLPKQFDVWTVDLINDLLSRAKAISMLISRYGGTDQCVSDALESIIGLLNQVNMVVQYVDPSIDLDL